MNHLTVGMRMRKMNLPFYLLCSGYIPSVNTLREEIFAGINFANFFFGHFTGINFRELGFTVDFAGINFRELTVNGICLF